MAFVRTILAALIATSLVLAPLGGTTVSATPFEMAMADQADMPCCPADDGKSSVVCAFKCVSAAAAMLPAVIAMRYVRDELPSHFVEATLQGYVKPPAHPPPI